MSRPLPISGNIDGVDQTLVARTAAAWGYVVPGGEIRVSTGVSSHSPVNHAPGHAIDFAVYRPDGSRVLWNDPETLYAAQIGRSMGINGIGAGRGYMGGHSFHWDISRNGPRTWSDSGSNQDHVGFGQSQYAQVIAAATGVPTSTVLANLGFDGSSAPTFASNSTSSSEPPGFALEGIRQSLAGTESSGDYSASNNVAGSGGRGHFGRLQFSRGRLAEAQAAGVMPRGMTSEQFLADPDTQRAVEEWHLSDINSRIESDNLTRFEGRTINGRRITRSGMIAMAHLGGYAGMRQFLETGGRYNPADAYGTSLLDYAARHADAPLAGPSGSFGGDTNPRTFGQYAGSTATVDPAAMGSASRSEENASASASASSASASPPPGPTNMDRYRMSLASGASPEGVANAILSQRLAGDDDVLRTSSLNEDAERLVEKALGSGGGSSSPRRTVSSTRSTPNLRLTGMVLGRPLV